MLFMCAKTLMFRAATLAHAVHVCEHKFDVTFIECVATLAHVVNVREHKFDVMLIEYDVMLAHTQQKKHLNKVEANPFCPKRSNPMEEPKKIVGSVGAKLPVEAKCFHHTYSQVPFWKNFPNACGRVEKRCF